MSAFAHSLESDRKTPGLPACAQEARAYMNNRYLLMRHGESQANLEDLIISDPLVGCRHYGLTEKGKEQARKSAQNSGLGSDTIILCSDFLRTQETAEAVREVLGCQGIQLEPGLRERFFGELEGSSGQSYRKVWAEDSRDPKHTLFAAESPSQLSQRLSATFLNFEERFSDKTLLLVSHGDTLRFLQLVVAQRALTEHLQVRLFEPAEIRALADLPKA